MFLPSVIDTFEGSKTSSDILSRLLQDRIIFLTTDVNDAVATSICAQLLFLESQDAEKEISFYINSPGGSITAGMAIYDTMRFITCPICTVCMGQAASMGSFLLSAGTKGMRYSLPNAQMMIHQPLGQYGGQATDIEIHSRQILYIKEKINKLMAEHTGQSLENVTKATERDNYLTPNDALQFGLIDRVISTRTDLAA